MPSSPTRPFRTSSIRTFKPTVSSLLLSSKALADLEEKGVIKKVVGHSKLSIYTRAVAAAE
ncbi:unnamed protein product [Tuber melanosporum]|uniref:(Perigord truffle) hypothetical protein n=1 Tax=Tuber melanosporum (strain Mel28) TaxID=656061 RepID=D5GJB1_TUBMM|nr:uncharacterized protein GSTUM_00008919001 [Tuber melanosporum]CAZ84604.1 unnamed protein product [Tuber melanosporum]